MKSAAVVPLIRPSLWLAALFAAVLSGCGASATSTPTPSASLPQATPTPSPAPTATPSPAPTSAPIGELTVSSVGINVPIDGSCGDQLTYVPVGSQVCYWDVTAGGGGFYSFAGSSTSALSTLSRVAAGAIVTWTVAGKSFTRKLSGKSQTFPLDTGHDVPSGQPAYLQIRTATTVVEYDAEK